MRRQPRLLLVNGNLWSSLREARFSLEDVFISVVEQARLEGKVAQDA